MASPSDFSPTGAYGKAQLDRHTRRDDEQPSEEANAWDRAIAVMRRSSEQGVPELILTEVGKRLTEDPLAEQPEDHTTIWQVAKQIGKAGLRLAFQIGSRLVTFVLNFAKRLLFGFARFIMRGMIVPLLQGLGAFLLTPVGAIVGGLVAIGGLSYFLYRTFFKGDNPASVPTGESEQPEEEPKKSGSVGQFFDSLVTRSGLEGWYEVTLSTDGVDLSTRTTGLGSIFGRSSSATGAAPSGAPVPGTPGGAKHVPEPKGNSEKNRQAVLRGMDEAGMTDTNERAMFLAQVGHESGNFVYQHELWGPTAAQRRYEGRKDLGNLQPGDGYKYRGRGFIQLTGRTNYQRAGKYLGLDLEGNPDIAANPDVAVKIALWYWRVERPKIPAAARRGDINTVTKMINGGFNGLDDRQNRYAFYLNAMKQGKFLPGGAAPAETSGTANAPSAGKPITTTPPPATKSAAQVQQGGAQGAPFTQNQETQYLKTKHGPLPIGA